MNSVRASGTHGNVQVAVLEAIADAQPIEAIATLVRSNIERLMPGAAVAVVRADRESGAVSVAGPSSIAEHIEALAQCPAIAAREESEAPFPVEIACGPSELRSGWVGLRKVSAFTRCRPAGLPSGHASAPST